MPQQSLVRIHDASHILGVSEATLRQWTDEGKIKAFITPGGHRRYSSAELSRFKLSHQRLLNAKDVAAELGKTIYPLREIVRTYHKTTYWHSRLDQESQERLAELGRRLLSLITRSITHPSKRDEILKLARDAGCDFGEILYELGLPLADAVEVFLLHRNPIIDATVHLLREGKAFSRRIIGAIPLETQVMDEALVALVIAYKEREDTFENEAKGAAG